MGTTAEKILAIARKELGEREYPPNSNKVKYNAAYYGWEVNGSAYPWCAVFVWWVFQQAGAPELYYNGEKTAYCPTLMSYHTKRGQAVKPNQYQAGDVIFFNFSNGTAAKHVGICESFDGTYITTIDGNTGTGNEANGGAVMRRKRHKKYIIGAYRPNYGEGDSMMTEGHVREIVREELNQWILEQNDAPLSADWQKEQFERVTTSGITDGTRPLGLCTRLEAAIMAEHARMLSCQATS